MPKTIDTLVSDIQELFQGHGFSDALDKFSVDLGETFKQRFKEYGESRKATLRLSNYGKPLRQLYYELHDTPREALPVSAKFKFLFGDILESLLLVLAAEAGHAVEGLQKEVSVDGVIGHIDAIIDGVLVDVKSASTFSYKKFVSGGLRETGGDPFGYIPQLAAYSLALGSIPAGFLVVDKTLGNIHLERFSSDELKSRVDVSGRIAKVRETNSKSVEPERCYEPVPLSKSDKSGNLVLGIGCSYCGWKDHCWRDANGGAGLKVYQYATGPKWFVEIKKTPRVDEYTPVKFPTKDTIVSEQEEVNSQ